MEYYKRWQEMDPMHRAALLARRRKPIRFFEGRPGAADVDTSEESKIPDIFTRRVPVRSIIDYESERALSTPRQGSVISSLGGTTRAASVADSDQHYYTGDGENPVLAVNICCY